MFAHVVNELEKAIAEAAAAEIPALIGELERLKALVWARMVAAQTGDPRPSPSPAYSGRWLTAEQAAKIFSVTPRWLYRHKKQLPHSQPSRKVLLFPEDRLRRWFEKRT